jgi:signal transduction histidine kinase
MRQSVVAGERDAYQLEARYLHSSGADVWAHVTSSAVRNAAGDLLYLISVIQDITEQKQAEESVRTLSGRLIIAQEEERARIAREIHDDFTQRLALLRIEQEQLQRQLHEDQTSQRARLVAMSEQVTGLTSDLRRLSHELHSTTLEHIGLSAALSDLCTEFSQAHDIHITLCAHDLPADLPPHLALCLFRVAQQALANVVTHSGADRAEVDVRSEHSRLVLRVTDAGCGFSPALAKRGLGVVGMRERVRLVGGTLHIDSQLGRGTELTAVVPLPHAEENSRRQAQAGGF